MAQYTSEKFNLSYYSDGTSPYSIELGNDNVIITTDTDGTVTDSEVQAATQTTVAVFRGEEEITSQCYYKWSAYSGTTKLEILTGSNNTLGKITTNAIKSLQSGETKYDNAKLEVAVYSENDEEKLIGSKVLTVSKSKTGAPGTPAEVYQLYIMPNIVNINKIPETGQKLTFGALKVSGAEQTPIIIDGTNYQIINTDGSNININNVVVNSDFTGETYQLQRYIDKKWVTVDTESVGVTYNGDEGDPARDFNVTASSYMFAKNKEGQFTNSPIKLTAHAINLGDSVQYQWSKWEDGSFKQITGAAGPEYNATGIGRYQCIATFGNTSMADEVSLGETLSGTDAIAINITNPTMTFNYKDVEASETCQVIVMRGETPITFSSKVFSTENPPQKWCYTIDNHGALLENESITIKNPIHSTNYTFNIKVYKPENSEPVLSKNFNIQVAMVSDGQNATTVLGLNLSRDSDLVPANSVGIVTPEKALNGATTTVSASIFGQIQTDAEITCEVKAIIGNENYQTLTKDTHYTWDSSIFTLTTWQNDSEIVSGWDSVVATFTYTATPTGYSEQTVEKMFVMTKVPTEPGEKGDNAIDYELKVTPEFFNNLFICDNDKIEPPIINISVIEIDGINQKDVTSTALKNEKIDYKFGNDEKFTILKAEENLAWEYGQTSLIVRYEVATDVYISQEVNFLNNPNQNLLLNSYLNKTYQPDNKQLVQLTLSEPISQGKYSISLREDAASTGTRNFTATLGEKKISLNYDSNTQLYAGSFTLNNESKINTITIGLEDGDVREATIKSVKLESGIGVTPWVAAAADSVAVFIEAQYVNSLNQPDDDADWRSTIPSSVQNQYTWMRQKLSTDTTWSAPIRLTGEDAGEVQYIYYLRSTNGKIPTDTPTDSDVKEAGPDKWTNNPTGISSDNPEEYMSFKTKPSGPNTQWSGYSTPALWSKWGDKGQDGAGVIYKFYRQQNNTTPPTYSSTSTDWKDNPQGVTSTWKYEYVAVIKTYYDENGDLKENTNNVSVSLWNHYVKDGDPAKDFDITASAYVFTEDSNGNIGGTITFTAKPKNLTNPTYSWNGTSNYGNNIIYTLTANNFGTGNSKTITCYCKENGKDFGSDSITIYRVPKGSTGASGNDAIVIGLTNGNMTFNKANTTATETTTVIANSGSNAATYSSSTPGQNSGWKYTISKTSPKVSINSSTGEITVTNPQEQTSIQITITMYYNGAKKNEKVAYINCSIVEDGDQGPQGEQGGKGDTVTSETYTVYRYYRSSAEITNWTPALLESSNWKNQPQGVNIGYMFEYVDSGTQSTTTTNNTVTSTSLIWNNSPTLWARFGSDATVNTYNTFNALTNNGTNQGIYYDVNGHKATVTEDNKYQYTDENGKTQTADSANLYVNASMIKTGTFAVSDSDNNPVFSASAAGGANSVQIGGFNVNDTALFSNSKPSFNDDTTDGVYLGTDGIGVGKGNYIKADGSAKLGGFTLNNGGKASFDGVVTAKQGDIAGWQLQFSEEQNFSSLVSKDGNFQIISQDASTQGPSGFITANRQANFCFTNSQLQNSFCDISTDGIRFKAQGSLPITLEDGALNAQVLQAYIYCVSNNNNKDSTTVYNIETSEGWELISNVLYVDNENNLKAREAFTDEVTDDFNAELIVTITYQIQIPKDNSSIDQAYLKIGEEREESFTYSAYASQDSILHLEDGSLSFKIDNKPFSTQLSCISFTNAVIDSAVIGITTDSEIYVEITETNGKAIKDYLRIDNTGNVMCNEEIDIQIEEVQEAILTIRVKYKTNNFMVSKSGKINSPTISYLLERVGSGVGVGGNIGLNYYNKTQIDNKLTNYYSKTELSIATEDEIKALFSET